MSKPICLEIPGEPMGKERPRFCRVGQFVRTITPEKTVEYETRLRERFATEYPRFTPLKCPVILSFRAYMTIPKSASNKKQADMNAGLILPTKAPDLDNILKIVCDAMNGLAYLDDSQIVAIGPSIKAYSDRPRLEIEIEEVTS